MTFDRDKSVKLADKIDGWMDRDELGWLYERATEVPEEGHWVEVGCWKGRSACAVLLGLPDFAHFHAVDTWLGDSTSEAHWEARDIPGWIRVNFNLTMWAIAKIRGDLQPSLMIHSRASVEAASEFADQSVDVVFVDADHHYDPVIADLRAWLPKIKQGGMICGHDRATEGVTRAVNELVPEWQQGPTAIWWARI